MYAKEFEKATIAELESPIHSAHSNRRNPRLLRVSIIAPFGRKEESHHLNLSVRRDWQYSNRGPHTRSKAATKEQPKTKRYPTHPHQP